MRRQVRPRSAGGMCDRAAAAGGESSCCPRKSKMSDLSLAEYRALAEFRHRLEQFLQRRRRAARDAGLPPMQYQLMLAVKGTPRPRTMK
jgi:hypothetical protein